ncbi:hypothetical protein UlMin_003907 [Ulmus minor]
MSKREYVLDKEIAKGSNGTIIFEGSYGARKVAVKRLVRTEALVERLIQADSDVGSDEYNVHVEADRFNNIVRSYGRECDKSFVYLFLELCTCSLDDLIRVCSPSFPQNDCPASEKRRLMSVKCILGDNVTLWKENGYPSPLLLKLMRDVVCGLMNLHENKMVHLNLTTRNILIAGTTALCAKLSDMARSKKFRGDNSSTSHRGTNVELVFEDEIAKDLIRLGDVLSFCINGGRNQFNYAPLSVNRAPPEAIDLISQLRNFPTYGRPKAIEAYNHPLFWDSDTKLSFLRDTSDRLKGKKNYKLSKELINIQGEVFRSSWDTKLDSKLIDAIEKCGVRLFKRYDYNNFLDLLRLVRNYFNHYQELPKEIQALLGPKPRGYYEYFEKRFPKLLIEVYNAVRKFGKEEEGFKKYFHNNLVR